MFSNFWKVAIRNLLQNKLYSAINILGLGFGLAAAVLIMLFVRDELSYDQQWNDADKLVRIHATLMSEGRDPWHVAVLPAPYKEALESYFTEDIDAIARLASLRPVMQIGDRSEIQFVTLADPEAADIFDLNILHGDLPATLADNSSIALSSEVAVKWFGKVNAVGETLDLTLTLSGQPKTFQVTAVYEAPTNTMFDFPALMKYTYEDYGNYYRNWWIMHFHTIIKLNDGITAENFESRMDDFVNHSMPSDEYLEGTKPEDYVDLTVMKVTDLRLHATGDLDFSTGGKITTIVPLIIIAIFILLIASINFMNLSTAKSTQRAREVALRKVLGATRNNLIIQFLGESLLMALLALGVALLAAELVLPGFGSLANKELTIEYTDPQMVGMTVGLAILVGILGGAYPAFVLSGFRPAKELKANRSASSATSSKLRSALVVLQFAISIILIVATVIVYGQTKYAGNIDPGFERENILVMHSVSRTGIRQKHDLLKERIAALPNVLSAGFVSTQPSGNFTWNSIATIPGVKSTSEISVGTMFVDESFINTFNIDLLYGRNFDRNITSDYIEIPRMPKSDITPERNVIMNQAALRQVGFPEGPESLGKVVTLDLREGINFTIVGIMPDVKYNSLRKDIQPQAYVYDKKRFYSFAIRYQGSPASLLENLRVIWRDLAPGVPFQYDYVEDVMREEFVQEETMASFLAIFSVLAVLIACLGLYGLASFAVERRTKEIGIRKVMGAGVGDIVRLMLWQFAKPVMAANLIAWPVAIYGMLAWLEEFPFRLSGWFVVAACLVAGALALMISWLTVGGNAVRVARTNPVHALRDE